MRDNIMVEINFNNLLMTPDNQCMSSSRSPKNDELKYLSGILPLFEKRINVPVIISTGM